VVTSASDDVVAFSINQSTGGLANLGAIAGRDNARAIAIRRHWQ
jgi:hypothetical protein